MNKNYTTATIVLEKIYKEALLNNDIKGAQKIMNELLKRNYKGEDQKITMDEREIKVHASHCCKEHGCKYGSHDCPVVNGQVAQKYKCEEC